MNEPTLLVQLGKDRNSLNFTILITLRENSIRNLFVFNILPFLWKKLNKGLNNAKLQVLQRGHTKISSRTCIAEKSERKCR